MDAVFYIMVGGAILSVAAAVKTLFRPPPGVSRRVVNLGVTGFLVAAPAVLMMAISHLLMQREGTLRAAEAVLQYAICAVAVACVFLVAAVGVDLRDKRARRGS